MLGNIFEEVTLWLDRQNSEIRYRWQHSIQVARTLHVNVDVVHVVYIRCG